MNICKQIFTSALLLTFMVIGLPARSETIELSSVTIQDINNAFDAGTLNSEKLVELFLARIKAYDDTGPSLNAVIVVNPQALSRAKKLDAERKRSGRRSPLHGIPVVLKDNIDTADMPTTAGSFMLKGSIPPDDAFIVKKLREAGAIILAKVNMSEFAIAGISSLGGRTRNPHNLARSPGSSSSGTGAAIAAVYAMAGLGTDTGGSIRGPSSYNGIVGLRPTHALVSRDGVVPLASSFDTVGPMARSVYDVAVMLGVMAGVDAADNTTRKSEGKFEKDYTQYLDASALQGARIGVLRDFMGQNGEGGWGGEADWLVEAALDDMKRAGATLIDITFPDWFIKLQMSLGYDITWREFSEQIPHYLATLGKAYPKTLDDLIERSMTLTAPSKDGIIPHPRVWAYMLHQHKKSASVKNDYQHQVVYEHAMPLIRYMIENAMASDKLDAMVYPTLSNPAPLVDTDPHPAKHVVYPKSALLLAKLTGFPDLVVPAGFTSMGLPVTISFLGKEFSEPKLLALGYAFEQRTNALRLPVTTPALPGEKILVSKK